MTTAPLLLSLLLVLTPGAATGDDEAQEITLPIEMSLDALDVRLAPRDARQAWHQGRRHLLGVYGYTSIVPGGPNSQAPAGWTHGVIFIAGTSDHGLDAHDSAFNHAALPYAERYNQTVLMLSEGH